MDKLNTHAFYELGEALSGLRHIKEGLDRADFFLALWNAENTIEKFKIDTSDIALKLSRQAAQKLSDQCSSISGVASPDWDRAVARHEITSIIQALNEFEAVFSNETQGLDVFSIKQKQAYSMTTLIEKGEDVLPESIQSMLSKFTLNEIREATKCIAFDLPTAAGFHMLRGLESALRDYYDVLSSGAPRPVNKHGKDVAMGDYINEVEKLGAHEKIVTVLRQIKTLHRDPHMHPQAVFHRDGALMLLGVITSAIWTMFRQYAGDDSDLDAVDPDENAAAAAAST